MLGRDNENGEGNRPGDDGGDDDGEDGESKTAGDGTRDIQRNDIDAGFRGIRSCMHSYILIMQEG